MSRQRNSAFAILSSILLTLFRLSITETPPSIPGPPTSQIVFAESSDGTKTTITLTCDTKDDTSTDNGNKREWIRSFGGVVPLQSIQNDGSLVLTNIQGGVEATNDGVRYQCIAGNSVGKVLSSSAVLTYAHFDEKQWTQPSGTITGYVGNQVQIPCTVPPDAKPVPTVAWYKDGGIIDTSSSPYAMAPSGNLYIKLDTTDLDKAQFHCQITNYHITFDKTSSTATLNVQPQAAAPDFEVTVRPKDAMITQGDSAFFEASAISNQTITFYAWRYLGSAQPKPGIAVLGESVGLVSNGADGSYVCSAIYTPMGSSSTTSVDIGPATLTVNIVPAISSDIPSEIVEYNGYSFTLECAASGNPAPEVSWYFNAAQVKTGTETATYAVDSASWKTHAGMYQCFAVNKVGEFHKTTRVVIRNATLPTITLDPSKQEAADPGETKHTCTSYADPIASITWYVDGTAVTSDISQTVSGLTVTSVFTYKFNSAMLAGVHTVSCMALNIRGNKTASSTVDIQVEVFVHNMPNPQTMYYEKPGAIACPYVAFPAPRPATWTHKGGNVDLTKSRYSLTDISTLNIDAVSFDDAGEYCCTLTNTYGGTDYNSKGCANATVDAHPAFIGSNAAKMARLSEGVELFCESFGVPVPTIRWIGPSGAVVDESQVTLKSDKKTANSTLKIASMSAGTVGTYRCSIKNSLAEVNVSFVLGLSNATDPPPATVVPKGDYVAFPYIAVLVPAGILILLVFIIACVQCRKRGSYNVNEQPNIKPFHVRAERNDQGELYAEAGPDIIQQRRKYLQEQAAPADDLNGQYATIGSKRSSSLNASSPTRPAPPYPGRAAPPYPYKVGRLSSVSSVDSAVKPPIDSPVEKDETDGNGNAGGSFI